MSISYRIYVAALNFFNIYIFVNFGEYSFTNLAGIWIGVECFVLFCSFLFFCFNFCFILINRKLNSSFSGFC